MEPSQAGRPFLNLVPTGWDPLFSTRRKLDYVVDNKSWIEIKAGIGAEDEDETEADSGEEENLVREFMRGPDERDICLPWADKVEAFCVEASLMALRVDALEGKVKERFVALLDQRSVTAGERNGRSRHYHGPMTARTLYREMKKPRFRCVGSKQKAGRLPKNMGDNPKQNENDVEERNDEHEEPDAERRLIFITDLDQWSILALIGTASERQVPALRDALYRHVAFENFVGVILPANGLPTFQLAFHLPYFAWRSPRNATKACRDDRRDANGNPLRHSQDVSFLDWEESGHPSFLYEAQISCVVSGLDEWIWDAYFFIDTYFDAAEEMQESVQSYHEDSQEEHGKIMDPLTYGVATADEPEERPKQYFLMVFQIRVKQVWREWEQVVGKLQQSIRKYAQSRNYLLDLSRELSFEEAEDRDQEIRRSYNWLIRASLLSTQLSEDLSRTVDACERFCLQDATYFRNRSGPADTHLPFNSLPAIQRTFHELFALKMKLESSTKCCDRFAENLKLQLMLENKDLGYQQHKLGHLQHKSSEDNRGLGVIMMRYVTPIILTAAVLSMNQDVIPFIPRNFGSFVGLLIMFIILGFIINNVHLSWCLEVLMGLVGQKRWDRKIRGPRQWRLRGSEDHQPEVEV